MEEDKIKLLQAAYHIRRQIIEMSRFAAGCPMHPGPALSCADLVAALYFKYLRVEPKNPGWPERDRFIISKGHGYAAVYAALAERGFFPEEELLTARALNSRLQGHPDMKKTPGIDMTSGSLGNGISAGVGMAYSLKNRGSKARVYVILGDGECQEGIVWEAALAAARFSLGNLTVFVDCNGFQSCGSVAEIMAMEPFEEKWKAFGWNTIRINGHDMDEICGGIETAGSMEGPVCILADTIKGKGISFMENNNRWHCDNMTDEEYEQAVKELEAARRELCERNLGGKIE